MQYTANHIFWVRRGDSRLWTQPNRMHAVQWWCGASMSVSSAVYLRAIKTFAFQVWRSFGVNKIWIQFRILSAIRMRCKWSCILRDHFDPFGRPQHEAKFIWIFEWKPSNHISMPILSHSVSSIGNIKTVNACGSSMSTGAFDIASVCAPHRTSILFVNTLKSEHISAVPTKKNRSFF